MKRGKLKDKFSKRFIYFFVALGIFTLLAGGVYAISSVSSGANSGHPSSDIDFSSGILLSNSFPSGWAGQINSAGTIKFSNGNAAQGIYVKQISVSDSWADNDANTQTNGIYSKGNIKTSGNIVATGSVSAGSFLYTSSDRNLKTNIQPLQDSLQKVLQLQGVSFNWKSTGQPSIGLIAQDVEKVYPELVSTDQKTGLKSVAYGNIVGALVESIKEQQQEINNLQQQINELKNKCN